MTPHEQLMAYDAEGTAYTIIFHDITHGTTGMTFMEYVVFAHSEDWVEMKLVSMQASPSGAIWTEEKLDETGRSRREWRQWKDLPRFEIATH